MLCSFSKGEELGRTTLLARVVVGVIALKFYLRLPDNVL